MLIAVIILGVLVVFLAVMLVIKNMKPTDTSSALMLKEDFNQLSRSLTELKDGLHTQISDRLDKNQAMMLGSLQKQFTESTKLISEVTKNLTELKESNKQVMGITDELKVLQNVLSNPKQRGVLGEYYLDSVLKNVLAPDQFTMQYKFKDGEIVDAVIR